MSHQFDLFATFDDPKPAPVAVAPDPEIAEEEPQTLLERLTTYASSPDVWASLAKNGATDDDLIESIRECYYPDARGVDIPALISEVRALFNIPAQVIDVTNLSAVELIRIAKEESSTYLGSGRSPLHRRIEYVFDHRGEAALVEAGWPTHDGAVYINHHTHGITTYAKEITKYLDEHAIKRGETRATRVKYLIENWDPCADPVTELAAAEHCLAVALAVKQPKPKKGKTAGESYDVIRAREAVQLLKSEIARAATKDN